MIKNLTIKNFKSIKDLQLDCKRVNLFIGEPNVGKSNLLEALGLFSFPLEMKTDGLIRTNNLSNLFFENDLSNIIQLIADRKTCTISYDRNLKLSFDLDDSFKRDFLGTLTDTVFSSQGASLDFGIHPYFFKSLSKFDSDFYDFLIPPHGKNLFAILQTNKEVRAKVSDLIQETNFKLSLRPVTSEIEVSKEQNNVLTTYPYHLISDTIQRIIFYVSAIDTNKKDTTIILEEPESNVFPYYTKFLAEKIALDPNRQYFITTHNPYFLQSVIEKTPLSELSVNLVRMDNYQTNATTLSQRGTEEILNLSADVFLNFDKLLEA